VIPAISSALGPLNPSEWSIGGLGGAGGAGSAGAIDPSLTGTASNGSFSGALSNAVDSLQQTQTAADGAAQALATGQATDPAQAISAVENASLAMDLAAQLRTKFTEAVNTIFQTQV
jgi:flagellar hook-basal body complex protein FliE